jgi:chromosome segregation ATPase
MKMGRKKKIKKIDLPHEEIVKLIYNSDCSLTELARRINKPPELLIKKLKEYRDALDLAMEKFKEDIQKTIKEFQELGITMENHHNKIKKNQESVKNYKPVPVKVGIWIGGKLYYNLPKKIGDKSIITQSEIHEM